MTSATAAADLRSRLCGFVTDEAGAVTVDWVVLTGAAVGLCIGMFASVNTGIYSVGEGLGQRLSEATVKDLGTVNDW
nr:hypothetical protein [Rhodovulum marinum]